MHFQSLPPGMIDMYELWPILMNFQGSLLFKVHMCTYMDASIDIPPRPGAGHQVGARAHASTLHM